jgi:hypothetical protein
MTTAKKASVLSVILRIASGLGFLIYFVAIVAVFVVRPKWVQKIQDFTQQVEIQILELDLVMSHANQSLMIASTALKDTGDFLLESEDLLGESTVLLESVGELIGEEATTTILSTQDALEAAVPGAEAIDSMLKALSVLEPLTGFAYDPEKSLSQGLEEVSVSLEPLPESLRDIQEQLLQASEEVDQLSPGLSEMSENLSDFSDSILGVSERLEDGEEVFRLVQDALETVQNRVASISWISTIIVSVFLALGAISQLSAFLVGKQL